MRPQKLKVLQVINSLDTGGAEKLLVDSVPIYINNGIQMDILLLNGEKYPFYEQLIKSGIDIYYLGRGSIFNLFHIIKIIPYLRKYDIIHVHLFPALYWVGIAKIISFSKTKLVFTEHSTSNKRMNLAIGKFLDRIFYKKYQKIVSITTEIDRIMKSYLDIKNINCFSVIENGVNLTRFQDLSFSIRNFRQGKVRLIQVSSFNKAKDQVTLIKSLLYLPENVEIYLVGEGEGRKKCETLVAELGLQNKVFFLGIQMNVPELLYEADIVVLSSHFEGFGLAAVEGMAAGKPLIASDVPGLSNVVEGAGILFPVSDEKALANEIQKLLFDEQYYTKTAMACFGRAQRYDINSMVDKYIDLYKELIN